MKVIHQPSKRQFKIIRDNGHSITVHESGQVAVYEALIYLLDKVRTAKKSEKEVITMFLGN